MGRIGIFLASAAVCLPLVCIAQVRKTESYVFESYTPTDEQFLAGERKVRPTLIAGELSIPVTSSDKDPLAIVLHGSGGMWRAPGDLIEQLNRNGIATLTIDSFTGRGITDTGRDQDQLGRLAMIVDAYRALELMARNPGIDPERVALIGWSRGGHAALYAALERFHRLQGVPGRRFAAHVVFYPPCTVTYLEGLDVGKTPVRLFHGSADDYTPVAPCRAYTEQLRKAGADVVLAEYAGARHAFDWPHFSKPIVTNPAAQTTRNCVVTEREPGVLVSQSGKPFNYRDPCVEKGVSLGYDAEASADAYRSTIAFLKDVLKPSSLPQKP